jgi:hypothetical protein
MSVDAIVKRAIDQGEGIMRLAPTWVPRSFCIPAKRIKLHPDDYYAFGAHRGGIDEQRVLLRDAMDSVGEFILGDDIVEKHGGWTMYSKFFDNLEPLPFHVHHTDEKAALIGARGRTVTISDNQAYGAIVVQGKGTMGPLHVQSPALIRFGQMTEDEVFVTRDAARAGVRITNDSSSDPLVMLKHFGPE